MLQYATVRTRRVAPLHKLWTPHDYQRRAVEFLTQQNSAALFLDPGLGKTSITLAAFAALKDANIADKMLVIAPLRVVQTVWAQEAAKWSQLRHLRFSVLHGSKKAERLSDDADVWLINPEGVPWLSERFFGRSLPFDTVVIDELTRFKNASAVRHKALRPRLKNVARRWGLTGTPAPNGYMDLFGQFLILDDGAALGRYITHFRDQYFQPDFNGFDYTLQPGGAARIEARIKPYVLRMSAEDYLELPPLIDDVRQVELDAASRKTYTKMKKDTLAELPEGVVTAANAAAVYSKLKQMANGAVYVGDQRDVAKLHDAKLDALSELVDELAGQPLLIAYEFNHDLTRLKERFGADLPYIGAGVSPTRAQEIVEAWNRGELLLLAAHPASAGHGLNLQGGGAAHVCWFSPPWDLELYEQFIQRVYRQGTTAQRIVNHILAVRDTIDDLVLVALRDKSTTQDRLLTSLTSILHDADIPAAGRAAARETQGDDMVMKLSRQSVGGLAQAQAQGTPRTITPRGWGSPKMADVEDAEEAEAEPVDDVAAQRERIRAKISAPPVEHEVEEPPVSATARSAFSPAVQAAMAGESEAGDEPQIRTNPEDRSPLPEPSAKRTTRAKAKSEPVDLSCATLGGPIPAPVFQVNLYVTAAQMEAIAKVLQTV